MTDIVLDGVTRTFRGRDSEVTALDDVNLRIESGELAVVVGPSGSGKSTLLDLLAGLDSPTSGQIRLGGEPITGPGLNRGVVFQQYALLPWRTAHANVELGLEANGIGKRERADKARHYLDLVGLADFAGHFPHQLSGGMRQRVAIARSLAFDPDVLLMDEPFGALDAQTREHLQQELLGIWRRTGKTIVFITHDIDEAVYLGGKVTVLTARPGRVADTVGIEFADRADREETLRAPAFAEYRHRIATLLHATPEVIGVG